MLLTTFCHFDGLLQGEQSQTKSLFELFDTAAQIQTVMGESWHCLDMCFKAVHPCVAVLLAC